MFGKGAEKRIIVGMAVTPNLGLEACVYDKKSGAVVKYGQKFIEYNIASKEIQDIDAFRSAVSSLLNELEVPKGGANIYLTLPNVHFGFRSIDDGNVSSDAIESMILADAGESYVFKQEDPISAWANVNAKSAHSKLIAHSSLQRKAVDAIQDAVMDLGCTLVGVESSATAIPRGIGVTRLCDNCISNNLKWDVLLINPNGYSIIQMIGNRIIDYIEVPFAIMSFDGDEVYSALSSAVGQYLPNYPAKRLVIVSLTDNVSAQVLKSEITFDEEILAIESNSFAKAPYVQLGPSVIRQTAASMSPGVLGAAAPKFGGFATLNVLGDIGYDGVVSYGKMNLFGRERDITSSFVNGVSVACSAVLLAATVAIAGTLGISALVMNGKKQAAETEIASLKSSIEKDKVTASTNVATIIKETTNNNKMAINLYDSLATDIPSHLWLTYYINRNGTEVGIEGFSMEINDIYEYFKSLKVLAPQSNIRLNKLQVFRANNGPDGEDVDSIVLNDEANSQQTFAFEISNTNYEKSIDARGNRVKVNDDMQGMQQEGPGGPPMPPNFNGQPASPAAKIPNVPDEQIKLKEIE